MKTAILFLALMTSTAYAQEPSAPIVQGTQGTPGSPVQIQQGSRPVPDPTSLTAEAIRELRTELSKWIEIRFADLQKQLDRGQLRLDEVPNLVNEALLTTEKLTAEKFKGLADQQVQRDNNLALALTAAQKSVSDTNLSTAEAARKAENTFKDQIAATQKIIDGLNDRVTRIESASSGAGGAINWIFAAATFVSVMIGIGSMLYAMLRPPPLPIPVPVVQYENGNGNGNGRRRS